MPNLSIEKFVYAVKKEILEAQKKHQGEQALFELKSMDLEMSVTTTFTGEGGVDLVVVQLKSGVVSNGSKSTENNGIKSPLKIG